MSDTTSLRDHWETIYQTKNLSTVGWHQPVPQVSLDLIDDLPLTPEARIIDIGGGDSRLSDHLLSLGFTNLSVLDISTTAIQKAKKRLGLLAQEVEWIVSDIRDFEPTQSFDVWHDRASFHFLLREEEISSYVEKVKQAVHQNGYLILGTFSERGPSTCSGLKVRQYSKDQLIKLFSPAFEPLHCFHTDHVTPGGVNQNYIFCVFKRM